MWVEADDGTALFDGDARFISATGLADAAAESFESYNAPGRFLRGTGGLAYVQTIATAQDRTDATFRLT